MNLEAFTNVGALRFYSYSRSYERKHHTSPLAFSKYNGKLYVQKPTVGLIVEEDCLAFVILHEIGHLVGKRGEGEATDFANLWLMKGKILTQARVTEINLGWRRARNIRSVRKRMRHLRDAKTNAGIDDDDLFEMALVDLMNCPYSPR